MPTLGVATLAEMLLRNRESAHLFTTFAEIVSIEPVVAHQVRQTARNLNAMKESAEQWNAAHPPGTRVRVMLRDGASFEAETETQAQQWGDFALLTLRRRDGVWTTQALTAVDSSESNTSGL